MRASALLTAALAPAAVALTIGMAAPAAAAPAPSGAPVYSGMEITMEKTIVDLGSYGLVTPAKCTLGAVVSNRRAITAGHCGKVGTKVYNAKGGQIGTITSNLISRRADLAVITLNPGLATKVDAINWSGSIAKGAPVSKTGITTGTTRGAVVNPKPQLLTAVECPLFTPGAVCAVIPPALLVNQHTLVIEASFQSKPGDSGSGVRNGAGQIVGIVSSIPTSTDAKGRPIIRSFYTPISFTPGNLR
ncbi:trypsin-like serine protease [Gordonia sp. X0973]|uniref:trypsin-like serine protease n=1 Tax=Gordonia sp. X0973 TaxID=2742602 RepID=UPI000F530565|nr:trypsin-like serine protease [Gordonia sp. X0973]QKT06878.1 trypsin-like serine protease [Gordonia sp. X0973]